MVPDRCVTAHVAYTRLRFTSSENDQATMGSDRDILVDITDPPQRPPLRLHDECARALALVIHALGLGAVALIGALVARVVTALT